MKPGGTNCLAMFKFLKRRVFISYHSVITSADDTAVYLTVQGPNDSERLQSNLNVLQEWEEKWDME